MTGDQVLHESNVAVPFPAIRSVLAAYRSTEAHITQEQITAAWAEYDALASSQRQENPMPEITAGPVEPRGECRHESVGIRRDGALDDHCRVCGADGYWHLGHRHDVKHPSGKILFRLDCPVVVGVCDGCGEELPLVEHAPDLCGECSMHSEGPPEATVDV